MHTTWAWVLPGWGAPCDYRSLCCSEQGERWAADLESDKQRMERCCRSRNQEAGASKDARGLTEVRVGRARGLQVRAKCGCGSIGNGKKAFFVIGLALMKDR